MIEKILALAMTVIPQQQALLFRWVGRETNDIGFDVDTFAPPVPLTGSIQPVDRSRYGYMGLDASKSYIVIYSQQLAQPVTQTDNPDQVAYMGRRYRIMSAADWHAPADYTGFMAVDIGAENGEPEGFAEGTGDDTHGK